MPYLTDVKGFSRETVTNAIFPVSIYASLAFYVVAGPISHALGTKSFVVLGAACKLATRMILIWGDSLGAMKLMQARAVYSHSTFSLNLRLDGGKYVLFIGGERLKTDELRRLIVGVV